MNIEFIIVQLYQSIVQLVTITLKQTLGRLVLKGFSLEYLILIYLDSVTNLAYVRRRPICNKIYTY